MTDKMIEMAERLWEIRRLEEDVRFYSGNEAAGRAEIERKKAALLDDLAPLLERLSSSEVTEEEVERVARAICGRDLEWRDCERPCLAAGKCVGNLSDCVIEDARAAITAMRSAATSKEQHP